MKDHKERIALAMRKICGERKNCDQNRRRQGIIVLLLFLSFYAMKYIEYFKIYKC